METVFFDMADYPAPSEALGALGGGPGGWTSAERSAREAADADLAAAVRAIDAHTASELGSRVLVALMPDGSERTFPRADAMIDGVAGSLGSPVGRLSIAGGKLEVLLGDGSRVRAGTLPIGEERAGRAPGTGWGPIDVPPVTEAAARRAARDANARERSRSWSEAAARASREAPAAARTVAALAGPAALLALEGGLDADGGPLSRARADRWAAVQGPDGYWAVEERGGAPGWLVEDAMVSLLLAAARDAAKASVAGSAPDPYELGLGLGSAAEVVGPPADAVQPFAAAASLDADPAAPPALHLCFLDDEADDTLTRCAWATITWTMAGDRWEEVDYRVSWGHETAGDALAAALGDGAAAPRSLSPSGRTVAVDPEALLEAVDGGTRIESSAAESALARSGPHHTWVSPRVLGERAAALAREMAGGSGEAAELAEGWARNWAWNSSAYAAAWDRTRAGMPEWGYTTMETRARYIALNCSRAAGRAVGGGTVAADPVTERMPDAREAAVPQAGPERVSGPAPAKPAPSKRRPKL